MAALVTPAGARQLIAAPSFQVHADSRSGCDEVVGQCAGMVLTVVSSDPGEPAVVAPTRPVRWHGHGSSTFGM